jgi:hypothetical protein
VVLVAAALRRAEEAAADRLQVAVAVAVPLQAAAVVLPRQAAEVAVALLRAAMVAADRLQEVVVAALHQRLRGPVPLPLPVTELRLLATPRPERPRRRKCALLPEAPASRVPCRT